MGMQVLLRWRAIGWALVKGELYRRCRRLKSNTLTASLVCTVSFSTRPLTERTSDNFIDSSRGSTDINFGCDAGCRLVFARH